MSNIKPVLRFARRALPWLLIGLSSSAATLLAMAPAGWVAPYVAQATAGRLVLADASGSLWQGQATLMLAAGAANGVDHIAPTVLPGRLTWRTDFWPIWLGHLHCEIAHTSAMPEPVALDLSWRHASLAEGQVDLPAEVLTGLGSPFNTLDLKGDLQLAWTPLRLLNRQAFGQINLSLSDLGSRVSRISPLGSYRLRLELNGSAATLALSTVHGPLLLDGQGHASLDSFDFDGSARAAPGFESGLAGFLNILGTARGDGTYSLRTMP